MKVNTLREIGFKRDNLGDTIGKDHFETMGKAKAGSKRKRAGRKIKHIRKEVYKTQ